MVSDENLILLEAEGYKYFTAIDRNQIEKIAGNIAGDPITGLKWTRKTICKIADALRKTGIYVSPNTVSKLL